MYSLTQRSMAFFCALEPEARSWPLAPSHLTLDAAFVLPPPVAEVSLLLSSEPHAVRTRRGDGEGTERGGTKPVLALKLHFRVFLPEAAAAACGRRATRAVQWLIAAPGRSEIRQIR